MHEYCPTTKVVITKYKMKRVLQKFGDQGATAVEKEVIQLLTMDSIETDNTNDTTNKYQCASLGYLMFLK